MVIRFISPIPPSANKYLAKAVAYSPGGKPYVHVYETKEAKAYKKYMSNVIKRAKENYTWTKTGENDYVECILKIFLPKKRVDADNLEKCLFDAITQNELIYDDSRLIPRVENIFVDVANPRIEVELRLSGKVGVFLNKEHYDKFENNNCIDCRRYSYNCSLLKKSIENKILEEIDISSLTCSKRKVKTS